MQEHDLSWVRTEMVLAQAAPSSQVGAGAWMRKNMFASPLDTALTILAALALAWVLPQILNWAFFNAVWSGADRTACLTTEQGGSLPEGWSGACWPFVEARFGHFMFGRYPVDERWRVICAASSSGAAGSAADAAHSVQAAERRSCSSRCFRS